MNSKLFNLIKGTVIVIALLIIWAIASNYTKPLFVPKPGRVLASFLELLNNGMLFDSIKTSFLRITVAVLISTAISIPLGLLIATYNRSVKWNREKREQLIREKISKIVNEYEELKYQWINTEKDLIIKYHNDRIEMYAEETGFNRNQLEHIIKTLYQRTLLYFRVDEEDFPSFKKMMLALKKIPEIE